MYTLRRISSEGVEMNFSLGEQYVVVHQQTSPKEFQRDFEQFKNTYPDGEIYCFVWSEGGKEQYPLFVNQKAFIMTETGRTFSNLTVR